MNGAYVPLPLKWRPQSFQDVMGQPHIVRVLQASLERERLSHAYLFAGPRGSGKTSTARILAKSLNCSSGPTPKPCLDCRQCREIAAGRSPDVLEIDGASNRGINEIRNLQELLRFRPMGSRYKIVIIDEVHMLTTEAFNALLKTLEEPPAHVVFVLATTEPRKVPLTILSRCQSLEFHRIPEDEIYRRLVYIASEEKMDAKPDALRVLARSSEGSLRDALSLLEQAYIYSQGTIEAEHVADVLGLVRPGRILPLVRALGEGRVPDALYEFRQLVQEGYDVKTLVEELLGLFHTALWFRMKPDHLVPLIQEELTRDAVSSLTENLLEEDLLRINHILLDCSEKLRLSEHPVILVELTLAKIGFLPNLLEVERALDQELVEHAASWNPDAATVKADPLSTPPHTEKVADSVPLGSRPLFVPERSATPTTPESTPTLPPFQSFIEWLRTRPGWFRTLQHLKDIRYDPDESRIILVASQGFAGVLQKTLLDTGEMKLIQDAMRRFLGHIHTIEIETVPNHEPEPTQEDKPQPSPADPVLTRYQTVLGGQILKIQKDEDTSDKP